MLTNEDKPKATIENINEDVFYEICGALLGASSRDQQGQPVTGHQSLKLLSSTNRFMRARLESMVFQSIYIDVRSWHITLQALELITKCRGALQNMKKFHLRVYNYAPGSLEPTDGIPAAFAKIMHTTHWLEKVSIDVPEYEAKEYQNALRRTEIRLPSIRDLELGPHTVWMVKYCPNATSLSTCKGWLEPAIRPSQFSFDLIRAARSANHIQSLEIEEHWSTEFIEATALKLPHLKHLGILGMTQYFKLKDFLPALGRLKHLKSLRLPMAAELDIGFCPPECGNAYMGPDGEEVWRQVRIEQKRAELRASLMVFEVCPELELVWVDKRMISRPSPEMIGELSNQAYDIPVNTLFD
jgi:hypothetical protein